MSSSERRLNTLQRQMGGASSSHNSPRDDDIVIVAARRTPICKAKRGGFKDTTPDVLLRAVLQGVLDETGISPERIGDICVGNVLQPGGGAIMARMAQLSAGLPYTIPLSSTNRQCASGLQAIMNIAGGIRLGSYDIGIGCGVESMSQNSMSDPANTPTVNWDIIREDKNASDCILPMGITSENVAEKFQISRSKQDNFAARSHARASAAQSQGAFNKEIVPVRVSFENQERWIELDDGIRRDTSSEKLGNLKPVFSADGTTTAGNSSQVSDGAAAAILMTRKLATELGLNVMGSIKSFAVTGVSPDLMGIGPAFAIPEAVAKAGISLEDVDVVELNEAFASQATYCIETLGILEEKINPLGGAIALGHPLGCTGARMVATLLHYMSRVGARYGIVSMCIGTGMGAAAVFEHLG